MTMAAVAKPRANCLIMYFIDNSLSVVTPCDGAFLAWVFHMGKSRSGVIYRRRRDALSMFAGAACLFIEAADAIAVV